MIQTNWKTHHYCKINEIDGKNLKFNGIWNKWDHE